MENNLPQPKISVEQLPKVIGDTFSSITKVEQNITSAITAANETTNLAEIASGKNAEWSLFRDKKREAIEALQKATTSQAKALSNSINAIKTLFESQQEMSKALRYLFGLGVANMTANRIVVRELELKLQHASKKELSDLARQEITNVILQLRAQEDMQYKLENHDTILCEHKNNIDKALSEISSFEERCRDILERTEMLQTDIKTEKKELLNKFEDEEHHIQEELVRLTKTLQNEISKLSNQLTISIDNKVSSALQETEHRLLKLEQYSQREIDNKTFLDSKLYKAIIGIISLLALIISFVNLLC